MSGELAQPLAGIIPALLLERLRDPLVQQRATGTPEILIQAVLDERMGEREAPRALGALPQQRRRNRLVQQVEQARLGQLEDRVQQLEVEIATDHRGGAERHAGVCAQTVDAPAGHLAHALGQTQLGQVADQAPAPVLLLHDRPGLGQVTKQLDREERVARGLTGYLRGERAPVLVEAPVPRWLPSAPARPQTPSR